MTIIQGAGAGKIGPTAANGSGAPATNGKGAGRITGGSLPAELGSVLRETAANLDRSGGSRHGPKPHRPDVTTKALGEESGPPPFCGKPKPGNGPKPGRPDVTTLAVGEEDGGLPPKCGRPKPKPPGVITTLAVGEEDGGWNR